MAVVRVIPWKVRFMLLCFFVLTAYSSAAHSPGQVPSSMSSNSTNTSDTFRRLPRDVLPSHYRITIKLNLTELTFQGDEIIDLEVQNETQEIVLNAMKLRFLNVSLCSGTSCSRESDFRTIPESAIHVDDSNQNVFFRLGPTTLAPGPAKLKILYTGKLENNLVGLYYANQSVPDNPDNVAVTTQFSPIDARRCFPGWDEPSFKATFKFSVVAPKGLTVLSNTPVESEETSKKDASLTVTHFGVTPKMPTYVIGIVVGRYDFIEGLTPEGVKIRVYTPVNKTEQGKFALEVALKALPVYSEYFAIPYHLPKLDMVAVPAFKFGAMENWGLITYRESRLLFDREISSDRMKLEIAYIIGHELSHQWFGNMVTMDWWTDLWLKEGFAEYFGYYMIEKLYPEYNVWTTAFIFKYLDALELDALESSHPIEIEVQSPEMLYEIFDSISYNKGCSIMRMIYNFLGEKDFRSGVVHYLDRYQYGNTVTMDLWKALEDSSQKPVREIMSRYTKQQGFPLVRVVSQKSLPGKKREIELEQEQFFADGKNKSDSLWFIPLTFAREAEPEKVFSKVIMKEKSMKITLDGVEDNEWIKLNPGTVGFYRTNYTWPEFKMFGPSIREKTMPVLDRLSLLDDMFRLATAGYTKTLSLLTALLQYRNENNYVVQKKVGSILLKLLCFQEPSGGSVQTAKEVALTLFFKPMFEKVGWDEIAEEGFDEKLRRAYLLEKLVDLKDPETLRIAREKFDAFRKGNSSIPANIRLAVYTAKAKESTEESYNQLMEMYRSSDLEEKLRIIRSLAKTDNREQTKRVLDFTLTDEVKKQDASFIMYTLAKNSLDSREILWNFVDDHCSLLSERYKATSLLDKLVRGLTSCSSSMSVEEMEQKFSKYSLPGTESTTKQGLERLRILQEWRKRDFSEVTNWFFVMHGAFLEKEALIPEGIEDLLLSINE